MKLLNSAAEPLTRPLSIDDNQ